MYLHTTKAALDAQAAAGGRIVAPAANADIYTKTEGEGRVLVLPLSMPGLAWLVQTYGVTPPPEDVLILLANIQAEATANRTAWAQT